MSTDFSLKKALSALSILSLVSLSLAGTAIAANRLSPAANLAESKSQPNLLAQQSRTQTIKFRPGATSAIVKNSVVRGTRDNYLLGARKGQVMTVKIDSLEKNAVFDVNTPPNAKGQRYALKQGVVSWTGTLPASGNYEVSVGTTRGNASYSLQVSIK